MSRTLEHDGLRFRDLDHDGVLSAYEDWRLSPAERADDLLGRLTIAEKVGLMMHGTAIAVGSPFGAMGRGTGYDLDAIRDLVGTGVSSFISRLSLAPRELARQNNSLQALAAESRLGIPLTLSSDPRHHFASVTGASVDSAGFSQWPETLGLGAIGDPGLVERFGDIVRQEYRAIGLHMALFPQADLATSPRWPRAEGTFGQDPQLVRRLVGAFVRGLQGGSTGVNRSGLAAVVKHWVGYGASRDGFDGHNYYGRFSAFPGGAFDAHVEAFLDAFEANVAAVMPTYNILEGVVVDGVQIEQVGAGFSSELLTGLLRGRHGFSGVIVSDWGITRDMNEACRTGVPQQTPNDIAMPWGVDHLPLVERMAKGINAGLDQIGGEINTAPLIEAVRLGLVSEQRIEESARRILIQKFELGLFDDPFVDVDGAEALVGSAEFCREGVEAQRRSITVLDGPAGAALHRADTVFVWGIGTEAFEEVRVAVTASAEDATVAVVRLNAPHETLHPSFFFGSFQHEGDLDFPDDHEALAALREISASLPTIVVVHLDRPAVLSKLQPLAHVLIAEFGVSDAALVSSLLGNGQAAEGRLPFALPSDMQSVLDQTPDRPDDCPNPLYPIFHSR
jgi:beta-glucosidase